MKPGIWCVICVIAVCSVAPAQSAKRKSAPAAAREKPLDARERATHLLDRFAFGARPGDLEAVVAMGTEQWFEAQLQPDTIPDNQVEAKLASLRSIRMSAPDLILNYPGNNVLQQIDKGKQPMPTDPQLAAVYATLLDRMHDQDKQKAQTVPTDAERDQLQKQQQQDAMGLATPLFPLPPPERYAAILAMTAGDRRMLLEHLRGDLRDRLYDGFNPQQRETLAVMQYGSGVAQTELQEAKLLRAVYSQRQLLEVMTDFWFNHFNVFQQKDSDAYYTTTYERDVIRKHALGKFRDLLLAVAQSPAMLVYLDNASSIGPNSPAGQGGKRGLNENYGRELLELHTLGVNGGYTQQDVTEAARVLTGWTVDHPERGGGFLFDARRHEPGDKHVLGKTYRNDGNAMQEGVALLDDLAANPATAHFVSRKLAQRFVSDDPPQELVEQMARTFLKSDGDIREVLRTMTRSPYFWSRAAFRAKVKTPFEFVVSSVRSTGTEIKNPQALVGEIGRMGMPLYRMQPPTGYSTAASVWFSSNALLERLNYGIKFSNNNLGTDFDGRYTLSSEMLARAPGEPSLAGDGWSDAVALLQQSMIGEDVSAQTTNALKSAITSAKSVGNADQKTVLNGVVGLLIGSPEFQRH